MNRRRVSPTERTGRAAEWRRAAVSLLRGLGALAVTGLVIAGVRASWGWVRHGDHFALRTITFTGLHRATEADLTRRAGLVRGENLFSVNTAAAAAAMEQADWVARARVDRALPDGITVAITERTPVAAVGAGGLFVVDADGRRIKASTAADGLDLPVLTGLPADAFGLDGRPASPAALAALHVLAAYQADAMAKTAPLSELHVGTDAGDTVYTAWCGVDPVIQVTLGAFGADPAAEMEPVLRRFERLWAELAHEQRARGKASLAGRQVRTIDLGNRERPEWVAVRFDPPVENGPAR